MIAQYSFKGRKYLIISKQSTLCRYYLILSQASTLKKYYLILSLLAKDVLAPPFYIATLAQLEVLLLIIAM